MIVAKSGLKFEAPVTRGSTGRLWTSHAWHQIVELDDTLQVKELTGGALVLLVSPKSRGLTRASICLHGLLNIQQFPFPSL